MLEAYQAFADYHDMMELTERARRRRGARRARRRHRARARAASAVDLAEPWPRATMVDLIREHVGVDIHPSMTVDAARAVLDGLGLTYQRRVGRRPAHPRGLRRARRAEAGAPDVRARPPARDVAARACRTATIPTLVERFEVVVNGTELANAYSELNDPIDQRAAVRGRGARTRRRRRRGGHRRRGLPPRRSSTGCRRPGAWASASTASSCCSPASPASAR